mmetsp:Transcript_21136/g.37893  ORF Transcript_21136/g.37893 Transcript_21136/m.37893 type:complete len:87 (-) Transcript_21136:1202-1462(-)
MPLPCSGSRSAQDQIYTMSIDRLAGCQQQLTLAALNFDCFQYINSERYDLPLLSAAIVFQIDEINPEDKCLVTKRNHVDAHDMRFR